MNLNAAAWMEALESGDYRQANGTLCSLGNPAGPSYCCLGVAAELMGIPSYTEPGLGYCIYEVPGNSVKYSGTLPIRRFAEWLGLDFVTTEAIMSTGISMNDAGFSFADIAHELRPRLS